MNKEKKIKILVVDDEQDFRRLLEFWLQTKGYFVVSADNGKSAVEKVKQENPDLVFMDLRMPVMDGIDAIKAIREFNKELPIIVISAYIDVKELGERNVNQLDISGIFYKERDFEECLPLLASVLRTHRKLMKDNH
ncbi:MAG: response regulator [Candidatus Omnitrophica bacterium]|nr:response regulator [Candidatus Omnitrophota bacterium]